ncbi:hypothetical protein ACFX2J_015108 [Malus domestica]
MRYERAFKDLRVYILRGEAGNASGILENLSIDKSVEMFEDNLIVCFGCVEESHFACVAVLQLFIEGPPDIQLRRTDMKAKETYYFNRCVYLRDRFTTLDRSDKHEHKPDASS